MIAITEGTDTPALREALMGLEKYKAKHLGMIRQFARPRVIPPARDMERYFRNRVVRLDQVLNATPEIQIEAGRILREIVGEVVLNPANERGRMFIEVRGNPSALAVDATETRQNGMITVVEREKPPSNVLWPKRLFSAILDHHGLRTTRSNSSAVRSSPRHHC